MRVLVQSSTGQCGATCGVSAGRTRHDIYRRSVLMPKQQQFVREWHAPLVAMNSLPRKRPLSAGTREKGHAAVVVVGFVFTLSSRSFYSTSAVHPVSVLVLDPIDREIRTLLSLPSLIRTTSRTCIYVCRILYRPVLLMLLKVQLSPRRMGCGLTFMFRLAGPCLLYTSDAADE